MGSARIPQEHSMKKLMFGTSDTGYWIPAVKKDPYPCGRRRGRARCINGEEATSTSAPLWVSEPEPAVVDGDALNQKNVLSQPSGSVVEC